MRGRLRKPRGEVDVVPRHPEQVVQEAPHLAHGDVLQDFAADHHVVILAVDLPDDGAIAVPSNRRAVGVQADRRHPPLPEHCHEVPRAAAHIQHGLALEQRRHDVGVRALDGDPRAIIAVALRRRVERDHLLHRRIHIQLADTRGRLLRRPGLQQSGGAAQGGAREVMHHYPMRLAEGLLGQRNPHAAPVGALGVVRRPQGVERLPRGGVAHRVIPEGGDNRHAIGERQQLGALPLGRDLDGDGRAQIAAGLQIREVPRMKRIEHAISEHQITKGHQHLLWTPVCARPRPDPPGAGRGR